MEAKIIFGDLLEKNPLPTPLDRTDWVRSMPGSHRNFGGRCSYRHGGLCYVCRSRPTGHPNHGGEDAPGPMPDPQRRRPTFAGTSRSKYASTDGVAGNRGVPEVT